MRRNHAARGAGASHPKGRLDLAVNHAWNHFSYHAGQRLAAFRFFLVIGAGVGYGFLRAAETRSTPLALVVGIGGILLSIAFWALEVRNSELVNKSRSQLRMLEPRLGVTIMQKKGGGAEAKAQDAVSRRLPLRMREQVFRYGFVFRAIYGITLMASVAAVVSALSFLSG